MFCGRHLLNPVLNWVHQGGGENQRSLGDLERWPSDPRIGIENFPNSGFFGHPCSGRTWMANLLGKIAKKVVEVY